MNSNVIKVSVLMTTYNGSKFICKSIDSILAQTLSDFELIIVDDASTDDTPNIIAAYDDSRIRYVRLDENLGVVGARNHGLALARGIYIAALDHDDLSLPTRLMKQVAWLDANPDVVLVGTGNLDMRENGRPYQPSFPFYGPPSEAARFFLPFFGIPREVAPFFLHFRNGMAYSSIMFRASVIEQLGEVYRKDFEYVDDFDLYHRVLPFGLIDWIREPLTICRAHATNVTRSNKKLMSSRATKRLALSYLPIFGKASQHAADLIGRHVLEGIPASDRSDLMEVGSLIIQIAEYFSNNSDQKKAINNVAAQIWWKAVRDAARTGHPHVLSTYWQYPTLAQKFRPTVGDNTVTLMLGFVRHWRLAMGSTT